LNKKSAFVSIRKSMIRKKVLKKVHFSCYFFPIFATN